MSSHFSNDRLEIEFSQLVRQRLDAEKAQSLIAVTTKSWIQQCAHELLTFLTGQQAFSIRQKAIARPSNHRLNNKDEWVVYDPESGDRHIFCSEQAVRTWLEQRHLS